jgi:hypothetical protein
MNCVVQGTDHSVRNSLELIALAHYSEIDHEHRRRVLDCTDRVDQTLRELFPAIIKPEHRGMQKPGLNPGQLLRAVAG